MVDCLTDLGTRTGIPVFYIGFLLAPLASNASELFSSMALAAKKDKASITAALQQCLGACIMNNTLGLAVFLALIYFKVCLCTTLRATHTLSPSIPLSELICTVCLRTILCATCSLSLYFPSLSPTLSPN